MAKPKKVARKSVRKAVKKAVKKPVRKLARKMVKKVVRPVAKKAARKPARKAAPTPAKKAVRKVAPTPAATKAPKPAAATKTPRPAAATGPGAGRFCWHDLMVADIDAALKFYTALFGWTVQTMDMGAMGPYPMVAAGGVTFGGVMRLPMPEVPPHWMPYEMFMRGESMEAGLMKTPPGAPADRGVWMAYFNVANVDEAASQAQGLGATVLMAPWDIAGVGRIAVLVDPQGAVFALFGASKA